LKCNKLEALYFSGNNVSSLPPLSGKLPSILELDLSFNNLSDVSEIGNLTSLQVLMLSNNKSLGLVPPSFKNIKNIEVLYLDDCPVRKIDNTVLSLKSLKRLSMAHCGLKSIPTTISQLSGLTHLLLNNNEIVEIPPALYNLSALQYLSLNTNNIRSVSQSLTKLTSLIDLDFSKNPEIKWFPETLPQLKSLKSIGLSGTNLRMLNFEIMSTKIIY
jgi:Leucine-rich repeat (LRR) protein